MSNYVSRTLTVNRSTYESLQSMAAQAASLRDRLNDMQNDNRVLRSELSDANSYIRRSAAQFDDIWSELDRNSEANDELREAIEQAHTRITDHAVEVQNSLEQMQSEFTTFVENSIHDNNLLIDSVMAENNRVLTEMIETVRDDTNRAIDELHNEVEGLVRGDRELLEEAQSYCSQLDGIVHAIEQTRHSLLLPGQFEASVKPQLGTARSDLTLAERNSSYAPTARSSARAAFLSALRFLEDVTTAEQEWQAQLVITERLSELVGEQLEGSRTIALTERFSADVDEWSHGALSETEQRLNDASGVLKSPEMLESLSTQELIDLQSSFGDISRELDSVVTSAYFECNTSQRMTVIAQRVNEALSSAANMQVIAHAYEGGDMRGNYRFITRNPSTMLTVAITVSRVSSEDTVSISTEADIVNYGNMPAETAERLVRETVNTVTNTVAGTVGGTSECRGSNEIVHANEHREDIARWAHQSGNVGRVGK